MRCLVAPAAPASLSAESITWCVDAESTAPTSSPGRPQSLPQPRPCPSYSSQHKWRRRSSSVFSDSVAPTLPPLSLTHAIRPPFLSLPSFLLPSSSHCDPSIRRSVKIDDSSREANWMGRHRRRTTAADGLWRGEMERETAGKWNGSEHVAVSSVLPLFRVQVFAVNKR